MGYVMTWRNKFLTLDAKTIDEIADILSGSADYLREMSNDGIILRDDGAVGDDYATLYTEDSEIAKKYGMDDERELYGEDFDEDEENIEEESD